uniref:Uncharacterized protein n=1 Tax=Rhizophora mucronata TaxID=61149 RepID=A0A2P2QRX8_RHIMU
MKETRKDVRNDKKNWVSIQGGIQTKFRSSYWLHYQPL